MSTILIVILAIWGIRKRLRGDKITYYLIVQFLAFKAYRFYLFYIGGGLRPDDAALLMVLFAYVSDYRYIINTKGALIRLMNLFVGFIVVSVFVSIFIYEISSIEALKGARSYLFVLVLPDLLRMHSTELKKLLNKIFVFNIFVGAIFIFQTFTQIPILLDTENKAAMIGFLGLRRFFSFPPIIPFCCFYALYLLPREAKYKNICTFIAFFTLLLIQSRGMIMYTGVLIVLANFMFKTSPTQRIIAKVAILCIGVVIINGIFSGETGEKTMNDFNLIFSENGLMEKPEGEATLAYRFYLVRNSIVDLVDGSFIQKIVGLGLFVLIPMSHGISLGITHALMIRETGEATLFNPDISYANILSMLGFVGTIIYLGLFVSAIKVFLKHKKHSDYAKMGFLYILFLFAIGLNGSDITYSTCLIVPFILLSIVENEYKMK